MCAEKLHIRAVVSTQGGFLCVTLHIVKLRDKVARLFSAIEELCLEGSGKQMQCFPTYGHMAKMGHGKLQVGHRSFIIFTGPPG